VVETWLLPLELQQAELPLRNRASAMHYFVARLLPIAVITETYVRNDRNLRPINRLIYYVRTATAASVLTHDPTVF